MITSNLKEDWWIYTMSIFCCRVCDIYFLILWSQNLLFSRSRNFWWCWQDKVCVSHCLLRWHFQKTDQHFIIPEFSRICTRDDHTWIDRRGCRWSSSSPKRTSHPLPWARNTRQKNNDTQYRNPFHVTIRVPLPLRFWSMGKAPRRSSHPQGPRRKFSDQRDVHWPRHSNMHRPPRRCRSPSANSRWWPVENPCRALWPVDVDSYQLCYSQQHQKQLCACFIVNTVRTSLFYLFLWAITMT